jgi:hypothetical protein
VRLGTLSCPDDDRTAPRRRRRFQPIPKEVLEPALARIEWLLSLGHELRAMPWLLSMSRVEYRIVQLWLAGASHGGAGRCGTRILDYLPFDPNSTEWGEWLRESLARPAAPAGTGSRTWTPVADRSRGVLLRQSAVGTDGGGAGGLGEHRARGAAGKSAGEKLPAGGSIVGDLPLAPTLEETTDGLPWDWERPELSCARLECLFGEGSRNWTSYGTGGNWKNDSGRGILVSRNETARVNRRAMAILCQYLRDYWRALLAAPEAAPDEVRGTYPFDPGSGEHGRDIVEGWPGAAGGPAPDLPLPGGELQTIRNEAYTWARVHGNFYVQLGQPEHLIWSSSSEHAENVNQRLDFGASPDEADAIGLALRFLEASFQPFPDGVSAFRHWESVYRDIAAAARDVADWPPFGFSIAGHDVVAENEAWHTGTLDSALCIVPRSGLDGIGIERHATARGNAADRVVSLNRRSDEDGTRPPLRRAVQAVVALREGAVEYLSRSSGAPDVLVPDRLPGCDERPDPSDETYGLSQAALWEAASRIVRLAALILHEGTHVLAWFRWTESTGVSCEWFDGPSHGEPPDAIPSIQEYEFESGIGALIGGVFGVVQQVYAGHWTFPGLVVHPHYGVTLFESWWEAVFRHNRAPLLDLQVASCECSSDGAPGPGHPLHWGWPDLTCSLDELCGRIAPADWSSRQSWPSDWPFGNGSCVPLT